MPTATKVDPKKTVAEAKKKAEEAKKKLTDNQVAKTATDLFSKIKDKTGASSKKVDEWQKTWLAMPQTRKKYEHLTDAPEIVGEEMLGMTNDIIQFIQGQEGGNSAIFKKIKGEFGEMAHHPIKYFQQKFAKGKEAAMAAKAKAEEGAAKAKQAAGQAKSVADKAKAKAGEAKKMAKKIKK